MPPHFFEAVASARKSLSPAKVAQPTKALQVGAPTNASGRGTDERFGSGHGRTLRVGARTNASGRGTDERFGSGHRRTLRVGAPTNASGRAPSSLGRAPSSDLGRSALGRNAGGRGGHQKYRHENGRHTLKTARTLEFDARNGRPVLRNAPKLFGTEVKPSTRRRSDAFARAASEGFGVPELRSFGVSEFRSFGASEFRSFRAARVLAGRARGGPTNK